MGVKKIILFIVIAIIAIALVAIGRFYYIFSKKNNLAEFIPAQAEAVVYVNTRVLIKDFIKDPDRITRRYHLGDRIKYLKDVNLVKDGLIDYSSDIAYVKYGKLDYILGVIDNSGHFEDYIQKFHQAGYYTKPIKKGKLRVVRAVSDPFAIAYTKNHFSLIYCKDKKLLETIDEKFIHSYGKNSFQKSEAYPLSVKDSAQAWFYLANDPLTQSKGKAIYGQIHYDTILSISGQFSDKSLQLLSGHSHDKEGPALIFADSTFRDINKELQNLCLLELPEQYDSIKALDFNKLCKQLHLKGQVEQKREVIKFVTDEDFNLKKVNQTHIDTVNACVLSFASENLTGSISNCECRDSIFDVKRANGYKLYMKFDEKLLQRFIPLNIPLNLRLSGDANGYALRLKFKPSQLAYYLLN